MNQRISIHRGATTGSDHVHVSSNGCRHVPGTRVALLGTGKMGSAIAERLSRAGFDLTIWNRTRSRAEALGVGRVADTPAAAARGADVVISSLTGPEAVRAAYVGRDGVLAGADQQLFIDMSTAGPDTVAELESAIGPTEARLVDAPILGSPAVVRDGQAAVLVGGEAPDVERATAVLAAIGTVRHVGPLGSAARLKLIANSMLGDVILAAAELQVAGEKAGLDPGDVFWALQRLVPSLAARRAGLVDGRHSPALFALRDLAKDLNLALTLFGRSTADVPLTGLARSLVVEAANTAPDLEITAVIRPYRDGSPSESRGRAAPAQTATTAARTM
jgi:3-hydroxyisobutyrate dehydrogenase-like beta-hydroxyacid dehydrogenase